MMLSWLRDKVKTLQNKNLLLIGLTISFIALAFQMIGFLFPFWMSSNDGPYSVTAGLWQVCGMDGESECLDIQVAGPGLPGWFMGVQALTVLAVIFFILAVICAGAKLFLFKNKKLFLFVATGAVFLGAVSVFFAVIVFAARRNELFFGKAYTLHFAYGFTIFGMLAAATAGLFFVLELRKIK